MATLTPKCLVQGTLLTTSAATPLYTVPGATTRTVRSLTICNTGGTARTVTVHLVASGGSPSAANMVLNAVPLAAGETLFPVGPDLWQLQAGDAIHASADSAAQVSLRADGAELA